MENGFERQVRVALEAEAEQWSPVGTNFVPTPAASAAKRLTPRLAVIVVATASVAAGALTFSVVPRPGEDRVISQVSTTPLDQACVRPAPGRGVPDCAVDPTDVGTTGEAEYVPAGWSRTTQSREAVPTGTSDRIESVQRRYGDNDGNFFVVTVTFGDVKAPDQSLFGGEVEKGLRISDDVLVVPTADGSRTRFLWSPRQRVVVDVDFVEGQLPEAEIRRVVAAIRG